MSLKAALYRLFYSLAQERTLLSAIEGDVDCALARQRARHIRPKRVWYIVPPTGGKYEL